MRARTASADARTTTTRATEQVRVARVIGQSFAEEILVGRLAVELEAHQSAEVLDAALVGQLLDLARVRQEGSHLAVDQLVVEGEVDRRCSP